MSIGRIYYTLLLIFIVLLFNACSSSTSTQRYKQTPSTKDEPKKTIRFTSKDDNDKKNDTVKTKENYTFQDSTELSEEEFDEIPIENNPIDKTSFVAKMNKLSSFDVPLTTREKILFEVIKYLDTPYKYGGNSDSGIDCSAFTKNVFQESLLLELPRSAREQFTVGEKIDKNNLKFGDLVFFNTRRRSNPGHVGIYLGDNQFVHASRTLGVTISSLDENYYKNRFAGGRRVDERVSN